MVVIIGYVIMVGSVLGGYALGGGHLGALWQPLELLMIGGSAVGASVIGNTPKVLKAMASDLPKCFKSSAQNKQRFMDLLAMLFEVLTKIRKEGLMAIENDVENPDSSALFSKYPTISSDHHLIEFITDYLRMMVSGNLNPMEIETLMDQEIETHHNEAHLGPTGINKLSDGLPAFGIVAAVMGVVHTMGSVGQPPSVLGEMIAHALVGTFLGILLAYGFVGPLAQLLENKIVEDSKQFECAKVTLLASLNGYAPALAVEFGRKLLFSTDRPTFKELEEYVKKAK
jgi:chemotaxis protein MotA